MTNNHDHNTHQIHPTDDPLLVEKCYRESIHSLLDRPSYLDTEKMYARILLEYFLSLNLPIEEIFNTKYIHKTSTFGYFRMIPLIKINED